MWPQLITFDESTGCAFTAQDEDIEIKAEVSATPQLRLPWRVWQAHASGVWAARASHALCLAGIVHVACEAGV